MGEKVQVLVMQSDALTLAATMTSNFVRFSLFFSRAFVDFGRLGESEAPEKGMKSC